MCWNYQKIIPSMCWNYPKKNITLLLEKSRTLAKNNENLRLWQVNFVFFLQKDDFRIIFWWFFDDFWRLCLKEKIKQNPRKSSKNHQNIILLLEKNQEHLQKTTKIQGFGRFSLFLLQKDDFRIFFWWFFDDFEGFALKRKSSKTLGNHQKINKKSLKNHPFARKNQENLRKNNEIPRFWQVFLCFFLQKDDFRWFFDDFWKLCFKEKIKQNPRKSLNKYQKIILLLEKTKNACQKQWKSKVLARFLCFLLAKGWF